MRQGLIEAQVRQFPQTPRMQLSLSQSHWGGAMSPPRLPRVGSCPLQRPQGRAVSCSVPRGAGTYLTQNPQGGPCPPQSLQGGARLPSDPQGKATSTYLWPSSQAHNLASHSNHQTLGISSRVLLKHNGKVLVPRLWVADLGQDIGAGAMQVIGTAIEGNVVDAPAGQAAATACRATGLDAIL